MMFMIEYFAWVARVSLRLAWLALFVLPGLGLMYAHAGVQRLAGQRVRPLPTLVYRFFGFLVAITAIYGLAATGAYS
jgi:hypothetical protein